MVRAITNRDAVNIAVLCGDPVESSMRCPRDVDAGGGPRGLVGFVAVNFAAQD
jgi:hypothetical protein